MTTTRSRSYGSTRSARGYASADRDEQRRGSNVSTRSRGGRGSSYDEYDDYDQDRAYETDGRSTRGRGSVERDEYGQFTSGRRGGEQEYDSDEEYDYDSDGLRTQGRGDYDENYDDGFDRDYDSDGRSQQRGRGSIDRDESGQFTSGRRGLGRNGRYETGSEGRGQGRGWYDDSREYSEADEQSWQGRRGGFSDRDYDGGRYSSRDRSYYDGRLEGSDYDREHEYEEDGRSTGRRGGVETSTRRRGVSQDGRSTRGSSRRGFGSMSRTEPRRIASMDGHSAHRSGRAHEWDSREAARAGRPGATARWQGSR